MSVIACLVLVNVTVSHLNLFVDFNGRVDYYLGSGRKICSFGHSFNPQRYNCTNTSLSLDIWQGYTGEFSVHCVGESIVSNVVYVSSAHYNYPVCFTLLLLLYTLHQWQYSFCRV